jgi:hypothetical protein
MQTYFGEISDCEPIENPQAWTSPGLGIAVRVVLPGSPDQFTFVALPILEVLELVRSWQADCNGLTQLGGEKEDEVTSASVDFARQGEPSYSSRVSLHQVGPGSGMPFRLK